LANTFDQSQIDKGRYGYQKQTYTWGPATLAVGSTQVFSVQNWNPMNGDVNKICILESLAATQNANVQLQWRYDNQQSDTAQGWTDAFPAGLRRLPTRAIAAKQLILTANNLSGGTIASFQLNYEVSVQSLTSMQRLFLGFALTSADKAALAEIANNEKDINSKVTELLNKGTKPNSFESIYNALFASRRLSNPDMAIPFHLTIPTGGTVSQARNIQVPSGLIYVLRGISMEGASAVTVNIDRDNDSSYVQDLNGAAWVQADELPWNFFMPFKDHISISITGTAGTYPVRLDIDAYMSSELLLQHLRMAPVTSKVQVGLQ
jgi:hypothetical protein